MEPDAAWRISLSGTLRRCPDSILWHITINSTCSMLAHLLERFGAEPVSERPISATTLLAMYIFADRTFELHP